MATLTPAQTSSAQATLASAKSQLQNMSSSLASGQVTGLTPPVGGAVNSSGQIIGANGQVIGNANSADVSGAGSPKTSTPAYMFNAGDLSSAAANSKPTIPPAPNTSAQVSSYVAGVNAANQYMTKDSDGTIQFTDPANKALYDYVQKTAEEDKAARKNVVDKTQSARDDVYAKQKEINQIQAQIASKNAQYNQANLDIQKQDIPIGMVGRQQNFMRQQQAIDIGVLTAQAQLAQGNLQIAQQVLNDTVQTQQYIADSQINYNKALLDIVMKIGDKEEKKLATEKSNQFDLQKVEMNNLSDMKKTMISEAIKKGAYNLISGIANAKDTNSLSSIMSSIPSAGTSGTLSAISQAVVESPQLLNSLTATQKGNVISELQSAGYDTTKLAVKPLSDTAIKEVNQTDYALTSLNDLKTVINNNLDYIGPISGFSALNPWSKARQVQAQIDRVKQTVGKALEGGVLRKEDEEKYKKILATMTDTPDTAISKIDSLITAIQGNLDDYKTLQQSAGKSLNVTSALKKKGGVVNGQTSTGNSYTITKE